MASRNPNRYVASLVRPSSVTACTVSRCSCARYPDRYGTLGHQYEVLSRFHATGPTVTVAVERAATVTVRLGSSG